MGSNSFPEAVAVLMVPLPIQGHLNQLLHLSRLIAAAGVTVHYVGTAAHNSQAQQRVHGWDPLSTSNITFHELPPLTFRPGQPDPDAPTKFPSHLQPLFAASTTLRRPVSGVLRQLCAMNRRVVVVYDSLMGSVVQDLVELPNAEAYTFHSVSAFTMFLFLWENLGRPFGVDSEVLESVPSLDGCFTPEFIQFIREQHKYLSLNSGRIYNTSRVLENQFLEQLSRLEMNANKRQWSLGPFNPMIPETSTDHTTRHSCLEWLDRQARDSVIFVSFGTTTTFTERQVQEIALGLEKSQQRFIWVLRRADGGDLAVTEIRLLLGFEQRVEGRGIVVRDWAPQLKILGHPATGGFMSHCGWNSCIESLSMGVPIAAWPMHSDQPRNAVLITRLLRVGIAVRDWDRRAEIVEAEAVEKGVRLLMASRQGEEIRKRAAELSSDLTTAVAKGGVTSQEFDSFIAHISR